MAESNHPPTTSAQESSSLPYVHHDNEDVRFICRICMHSVKEPVLTRCGHLYCWPCLYRWLEIAKKCPVCKRLIIANQHVIPMYVTGDSLTDTSSVSVQGDIHIPERPSGQSPVQDSNLADRVRGLMVRNGFAPIASARFGNFGITAGSFCNGEGQLNRGYSSYLDRWRDCEVDYLHIRSFVSAWLFNPVKLILLLRDHVKLHVLPKCWLFVMMSV
ncbi:hypothetical protein ACS0TY_023101 [Phlomoides rotata]